MPIRNPYTADRLRRQGVEVVDDLDDGGGAGPSSGVSTRRRRQPVNYSEDTPPLAYPAPDTHARKAPRSKKDDPAAAAPPDPKATRKKKKTKKGDENGGILENPMPPPPPPPPQKLPPAAGGDGYDDIFDSMEDAPACPPPLSRPAPPVSHPRRDTYVVPPPPDDTASPLDDGSSDDSPPIRDQPGPTNNPFSFKTYVSGKRSTGPREPDSPLDSSVPPGMPLKGWQIPRTPPARPVTTIGPAEGPIVFENGKPVSLISGQERPVTAGPVCYSPVQCRKCEELEQKNDFLVQKMGRFESQLSSRARRIEELERELEGMREREKRETAKMEKHLAAIEKNYKTLQAENEALQEKLTTRPAVPEEYVEKTQAVSLQMHAMATEADLILKRVQEGADKLRLLGDITSSIHHFAQPSPPPGSSAPRR